MGGQARKSLGCGGGCGDLNSFDVDAKFYFRWLNSTTRMSERERERESSPMPAKFLGLNT